MSGNEIKDQNRDPEIVNMKQALPLVRDDKRKNVQDCLDYFSTAVFYPQSRLK